MRLTPGSRESRGEAGLQDHGARKILAEDLQ